MNRSRAATKAYKNSLCNLKEAYLKEAVNSLVFRHHKKL